MNAGKETEIYNQGYMHGYNDGVNARIDPDYWTRLEHQYAGMAIQGMLANANHYLWERKQNYKSLVANAAELAHALVQMMKEERK